jgi:hypothetical protein
MKQIQIYDRFRQTIKQIQISNQSKHPTNKNTKIIEKQTEVSRYDTLHGHYVEQLMNITNYDTLT